MEFKDYLDMNKVKQKTPDPEEANSLLEKAKARLQFILPLDLTEQSAAFIFEDAYSAAREAAQSLMSVAGYKPYSHEATIVFVQEKHSEILDSSDANDFDRFRQLRADSEYRALKISINEARECLEFAKGFVEKVDRISK